MTMPHIGHADQKREEFKVQLGQQLHEFFCFGRAGVIKVALPFFPRSRSFKVYQVYRISVFRRPERNLPHPDRCELPSFCIAKDKMTQRSYEVHIMARFLQKLIIQEAIAALNSLKPNLGILEPKKTPPLQEMQEWLPRLNYIPEKLNNLNVIHVAGTKGKGSTCAFMSSILQQLFPAMKVGQFTSPHLRSVNERIKINSVPLCNQIFGKYFWEVWDRLKHSVTEDDLAKSHMPGPYRFMQLMAFHVFLDMKVFTVHFFFSLSRTKLTQVDTSIIEVGVGGEYDGTNIIPKPTCVGVTSLGMDHLEDLGTTLESIAWHKGGIFKSGVAAFTVQQPPTALDVLRRRAREINVSSC